MDNKKHTIKVITQKLLQPHLAENKFKRKLSQNDEECKNKREIKKFKSSTQDAGASTTKESHNNSLWEDYDLLSDTFNLNVTTAKELVKLFDAGNTIPFIARYRKNIIGDLTPDQVRDVKEEYDKISALKTRSQVVLKNLDKADNLNTFLRNSILSARSLEELEHIYAPYKSGSKGNLSERAKALGLEKPALDLLNNIQRVNSKHYVNKQKKELATVSDVEKGFMHIIASVLATDADVLSFLRKLRTTVNFSIECKKHGHKEAKSATSVKTSKNNKENAKNKSAVDVDKFSNYFDFKSSQKYIKPHQILAMLRGESLKALSVKLIVPEFVYDEYFNFCIHKWVKQGDFCADRRNILEMSIRDSYQRLVKPLIIREARAELKSKAEKASIEVFTTNLKHLLLMSPLKGRKILGIDPGFKNGCKMALISPTGTMLKSSVIYPTIGKHDVAVKELKSILIRHNCNLIALGNGTACRETEAWLSDLIEKKAFSPLNVTYTIVNECGASIYSCSKEAEKEFMNHPNLDPNIISAVSLARRLQEPLAELVKVEPKHLGVGMYQHDLPKKKLELALDDVVMECVSYVGVDLNTASQCLLKHVSGLSETRALSIINYRNQKGLFVSREELMKVKGIGPKVFEQCAGFLRVGPLTDDHFETFYQGESANRLDLTFIHPESYDLTLRLIKKLKLKLENIGTEKFINSISLKSSSVNVEELSRSLQSSPETVRFLLDALSKPLNFDLRGNSTQKPIFKIGLRSIYSLDIGCIVTGSVTNRTHFGCFVDIGIRKDALIHVSNMCRHNLQIGDKVECKVINLEINRSRVGLQMLNKL